MPIVEQDGATVESRTGTEEELRTALGPPTTTTPVATPATVEQTPVVPASPTTPAVDTDDDAAVTSEAGRALAKAKGKKELRVEFEERLSRATFEKHRERERADQLQRELDALKKPTTAAISDDGKPRLKTFVEQIGTTHESYEDAVEAHAEALADWKLSRERLSSNAERAHHAYTEAQAATAAKGYAAHADFDDVMTQFVQRGGYFPSARENRPPIADAILQHPLGHEIAYMLATEPETYQRLIAVQNPIAFAAELGKLLTRLEGAPAGSPPKSVPMSKAGPPVKPVVGQPSATSGGPPGDDASDDEYRVWANQQELSRRRRRA